MLAPPRTKEKSLETSFSCRFLILRRALNFFPILFACLLPWPGKDVPHTPNGLDVLVGVSVPQFLPHLADVHIDAAVKGRELPAKNRIHQALTGDHTSSFSQQNFQQIKFHRSKVHRFTVATYAARCRIEFNLSHANNI